MNTKSSHNRPLLGAFTVLFLCASTMICFVPVLIAGLLKLIPIKRWKAFCSRMVDGIASFWMGINNTYLKYTQTTEWDIEGLWQLSRKRNYLLIANHQSWLDIVVLQRVFNRKIPTLKFFIKSQLKWMPLLGFAWWAMGCPFMKRYSASYLEKKPHKKGKDLQATKKALQLYKYHPASLINFVEGTRFTPQKKSQQQSPYQHLLKPKAGGISFAISAMGRKLTHVLDVTIVYPVNKPSLWDFLCHRINKIQVRIRQIPIPNEFRQEKVAHDKALQEAFREWLNEHWAMKDHLISQLKAEAV